MTDLELAILAIEDKWWRYSGRKLQAIRKLGIGETRYYQVLNRLVDEPEAEQVAALLVHRLRRMREERRTSRCRTSAV